MKQLKDTNEIADLVADQFTDGQVVAWLTYGIFFGTISNKKMSFRNEIASDFEKHLMELRAFNDSSELYFQSKRSGLFYRLRADENGNNEFIEARQILWGTKITEVKNGYSKVYEDRGKELTVPDTMINGITMPDNSFERLVLTTRNYFEYNSIGQAGYVDSRFVKIAGKKITAKSIISNY